MSQWIYYMLHSSVDHFYKVWDPYLAHIGPMLSSSMLRGFPQRSSFSASPIVTAAFLYLYLWRGGWSYVRLRLDISPIIFMCFLCVTSCYSHLFLSCYVWDVLFFVLVVFENLIPTKMSWTSFFFRRWYTHVWACVSFSFWASPQTVVPPGSDIPLMESRGLGRG